MPLANDIVINAATIGTPLLRTLDALHLATAAAIGSELDHFVTYDKRLAEAAAGLGSPWPRRPNEERAQGSLVAIDEALGPEH